MVELLADVSEKLWGGAASRRIARNRWQGLEPPSVQRLDETARAMDASTTSKIGFT
jgi:hypothetical protein